MNKNVLTSASAKTACFSYARMIAVSNRHYFDGEPDPEAAFLNGIRHILLKAPRALILREKDLSPEAYALLAQKVLSLSTGIPIILHSFPQVAQQLGVKRIHLPLPLLQQMADTSDPLLSFFSLIGTSVHSVSDAEAAVSCGAAYCLAGNIFETQCKIGLPGRGLEFLREVSGRVRIPVYGIGGVNEENLPQLLNAGAAGGCMMSGFCRDLISSTQPDLPSQSTPL